MHAAALKRDIEVALGLAGAQAASFWRLAAAASSRQSTPTRPPAGPVPVPYPNYADSRHRVAGHKSALDPHTDADVIRCVLAAASGDAATAKVGVIWTRVKPKIQQVPPAARQHMSQLFSYQLDLIVEHGR
ncbi:MAG: hypothetical protein KF889_17410 [Alphaproteobacteria bacterium]|nr:hypothetical protein [Alphaproteobacteria bacterium]MCW5739851.1 hypothetical protein [Alphaproteobacteria bacterium]